MWSAKTRRPRFFRKGSVLKIEILGEGFIFVKLMSCPNCEKIKAAAQAAPASAKELKQARNRDIVVLAVSLASLVVGFFLSKRDWPLPAFPLTDPSWIAVALCGIPIFKAAWGALVRRRQITSALLISTAIVAAIALQLFVFFGGAGTAGHCHDSYIFAAGEIAFLMALGEMIEMRTVKKSREGIEALMSLTPKMARRKMPNGDIETVPADTLVPGEVVVVRPDDMIPADGVILEGETSVNQASLTGESVPVDKTVGDSVFAGTWNQSGALTLRVTKPSAENTISRLIALVREAEAKKAPIQNVADRVAAYVVPTAIVVSVVVFAIAYLVLDTGLIEALTRGVTILVVFCPCAFALATPTAIAAGIGNLARRGILVKSGLALERLASVDAAVFDKTGTLTQAKLTLEATFSSGRLSDREILTLCAAAELRSQHPIARAIVSAAHGISLPKARNIVSKTGVGIACDIGDEEILVCSFAALEKESIRVSAAAAAFAEQRRNRGETLVCVVADSVLEGVLALSDTQKAGVPEMVSALKSGGVYTAVLTGDNASAAKTAADAAGVDEVFAELLPQDKSAKVEALRREKSCVLMVGDGVNDAPALAAADCSVAMGALGSELAVETADVAILNDDLALIPGLLKFSKAVLKTIFLNFQLSIMINLSSILLSLFGALDPVSGAIVHNASSVLVVTNSALLMFRKKDFESKVKGV